MAEYKAVFHIDEMGKWGLLLSNVKNLLDAVDVGSVHIEVVANSEEVKNYDKHQVSNPDRRMMVSLSSRGVRFAACNNALTGQDISENDLMDFVEVVPAGF